MIEYTPEWRQCSVCKADARTEDLVHYSTRRYAHGACLYKRDGFKTLETLRAHQLRRLPVLPMSKAGCSFNELMSLIERVEVRDKTPRAPQSAKPWVDAWNRIRKTAGASPKQRAAKP